MRSTLKLAAIIYSFALLVVLAAAIPIALADPSWMREWLNLEPQPPGGLRDLARILARNIPLAAAVLLLGRTVDHGVSRRLADGGLLTAATVNLLLAGVAVGSYGAGLGLRFAIYGPLELAAFSLAAATYVTQRRHARPPAPAIVGLTAAFLLVAGCTESYVPPLT